MIDKVEIEKVLKLISEIMDEHTENTDRDKAYRNCARMFLALFDEESVDFEEE